MYPERGTTIQIPEEPRPLSLRAKIITRAAVIAVAAAFIGETTHQTIDAHGCSVKPDNNLAHLVTSPFADAASQIIYTDKDARQCP